MNLLKLNFSKSLLIPLNSVIIEPIAYLRTVHGSGKRVKKKVPIVMSYASYESTNTSIGPLPAPIIVMHGLFGSKGNWNSLCKVMHSKTQPQRKVIAVDARNHGDSPHINEHSYDDLVLDIKSLMESHNIPKACVLGHSMGGRAMMLFALRYPELVEKLIVVDISPCSSSPSMNHTFVYFEAMRNLRIEKNIPLSVARQQADSSLARTIQDKGIRSFILTNLVRKTDGSYSWRINIDALMANYKKISTFPADVDVTYGGPTLFLSGGASDFIQNTDRPTIKKLFPNSVFEVIEGAGHWLHSEKPNEFLKSVTEFLDKDSVVT